MRQDLFKAALAGDAEAALLVMREALRATDWDTMHAVSSAMVSGAVGNFRLTSLEMLKLGCRQFDGSLIAPDYDGYLPADVSVTGDVNLQGYTGETFPEGWTIGGMLNLRDSKVTRLPKMLVGSVCLIDSQVREVDPEIEIRDELNAQNCPLETLPEGFALGSLIMGDQMSAVPDGLNTRGSLNLSVGTTRIGSGVRVGGVLSGFHSRVSVLPGDLQCGSLSMWRGDLETVEDGVRVAGDVHLSGPALSHLGVIQADGFVDLSGCRAILEVSPYIRARTLSLSRMLRSRFPPDHFLFVDEVRYV